MHVNLMDLTAKRNAAKHKLASYNNIVGFNLLLNLKIALDLNWETICYNNNVTPMKPRNAITVTAHFV